MAYVTVEEVARAMLADPTKKIQGDLIELDERTVDFKTDPKTYELIPQVTNPEKQVLSCAIGGAALLLELNEATLMRALMGVDKDGVKPRRVPLDRQTWDYVVPETLAQVIIDFNDSSKTSKAAIGKRILEQADEKTLKTRLRVAKKRRKFKITAKGAA